MIIMDKRVKHYFKAKECLEIILGEHLSARQVKALTKLRENHQALNAVWQQAKSEEDVSPRNLKEIMGKTLSEGKVGTPEVGTPPSPPSDADRRKMILHTMIILGNIRSVGSWATTQDTETIQEVRKMILLIIDHVDNRGELYDIFNGLAS
jgi:hypothetical protein